MMHVDEWHGVIMPANKACQCTMPVRLIHRLHGVGHGFPAPFQIGADDKCTGPLIKRRERRCRRRRWAYTFTPPRIARRQYVRAAQSAEALTTGNGLAY